MSRFSTISSTRMVPGVDGGEGEGEVASLRSTTIPLREQIRCRRLWFFHHDIRALTTSFLPLPLFLAYRILLFSYTFIWLILHGNSRSSTQGARWLSEITNLSYTFLVITLGSMMILCSVYTAIFYIRRQKLLRFLPKEEFPESNVFRQDNIPWYVKMVWISYVIAVTINFLVVLGYWILVYNPCKNEDAANNVTSNLNESETPATTEVSEENCSNLDASNLHVHFVNAVLILVDIFLSRVPFQVLHFFYPFIFTFCYSIFTILYWVGGGTDRFGNPYIYSTIDFSNNPTRAFTMIVFLVPSPIITYFILCPLALLRDFLYSRISCCYWNLVEKSPQEYENNHEVSKNGTAGANGETTL